MKPFVLTILLLLPFLSYGFEHPAEEAQAKMESAQKHLGVALQRIEKGIMLIGDKEKQESTSKAFSEAQSKWKIFVNAEVATFLSATPVPASSTAAMLGAYDTETCLTEARAKALIQFAEFLEANYK